MVINVAWLFWATFVSVADGNRIFVPMHKGSFLQHLDVENDSASKPPKIFDADMFKDKLKRSSTTTTEPMDMADFKADGCGTTVKVTSKDDKDEHCPAACPYHAQDRLDDEHCTFVCVAAFECPLRNPNKPIADDKLRSCRAPMVDFCSEYNLDGTDSCKTCQSRYKLSMDGKCEYQYYFLLYSLLVLFIGILLFLIIWVTDLCRRPETNEKGLKQALAFRSDSKVRQPKGPEGHRHVWPLSTDMVKEDVAGPGMMLHFTFQKSIICWALFVGACWVLLALIVDNDLFILGTRKFGSPRANCILVAWGYETQQRLMWTKILFLVFVYTASFFLALVHGVRQLRLFEEFDFLHKSGKDFTAMLVGLPPLKGEDKVEVNLQKLVADATGKPVVGVSVCWNFHAQEEIISNEMNCMLEAREKDFEAEKAKKTKLSSPSIPAAETQPETSPGVLRTQLLAFETSIFGPEDVEEEGPRTARHNQMLQDLRSSQNAFVVFHSEAERDAAVAKVADMGGLQCEGTTVKLEVVCAEADTVKWQNFGDSTLMQKVIRLLIGFGCIVLALTLWTCVFYAPYAWSIFNFNYDNGQEPGFIYGLSFSMVVVVGNAIMYEVCNRVSEYVGFRFNDDKESCYMILYTIACTFNIMVDMVTTYYIALFVMQGLDFRTYHGRRLSDIEQFHNQFETYAMQRSLADNTFAYAFPSTFLIPFLIEPAATIYLPYKIGWFIVRSHPELFGRAAEDLLAYAPMELGRYADILLNMILGILIFFFPGGFTHTLFFAMAFCQMYIYAFDKWKVLSAIPAVTYASMDIDWWSQVMLAPCCGLMLSCLVFKGNCQDYGYCLGGITLVEVCTLAFFLHCIVHVALLKYLVPCFGVDYSSGEDPNAKVTYKDWASTHGDNFFTTNPVNCLRSKLIYGHVPHCSFFTVGKEQLLQVNPTIGNYFFDDSIDVESEDTSTNFKAAFWSFISSMHIKKDLLGVFGRQSTPSFANEY